MKILVDEMPCYPEECPFCDTHWHREGYGCMKQEFGVECKYFDTNNPDDCHLLKVKEDEKRVNGEWETKIKRLDLTNLSNIEFNYSCSLCKSISDNAAPYCPGCGAEMEVKDEI